VELRREFDRMKAAGLTPRRYGLRVREHPGGLLVTAMNKMSHARTQRLSYAGQLVQTAHFVTASKTVRENASVVERFLDSLGGCQAAKEVPAAWLWKGVKPAQLLDSLLRDFSVAPEGWRLQKPELMEFISKQAGAGELTSWTVALVNTKGDAGTWPLSGCDAGIAVRTPEDGYWVADKTPPVYAARKANIQSPAHQALDLGEMTLDGALLVELLAKRAVEEDGGPLFTPPEEILLQQCCAKTMSLANAAEELTKIRKQSTDGDSKHARINGEVARHLRPKTHGLLLIYPVVPDKNWLDRPPFMGLAFSFPSSHTARAVDYKVNKVWQATFRDEDYTDAD
jgi:hypothetical protein